MKRILSFALVAMLALGLVGCSQQTGAASDAAATKADGTPASKTWAAIRLGPNETKRLDTLAPLLKLWSANEKKAGRTPADLASLKPRLVGYRVQIWAKQSDGTYSFGAFQVTGGRVDQLGNLQAPLQAKNVALLTGQRAHLSEGVVPTSAGEKDAVAKAVAWAEKAFPGQSWGADIQGYEFYYDLKSKGYMLFIPNAKTTGYMSVSGVNAP
jgi:hypothetical protein